MADQRRVAVQMEIDQAYKRHTAVFAGIHDYARKQPNWRLIIDEWAERNLPARGEKPSPYDGVVGRISTLGARRARRLALPMVNVWFASPAKNLPGVFPDYAMAGRLRAEHLLARGFRNFGAILLASHRATVVETEAFEQTVREAGCDEIAKFSIFSQRLTFADRQPNYSDWQRSTRTLDRWLDTLRLPVGLYVFEISTARLLIEMCRDRGWLVPQDVAIVAGMNEGTVCERPEPSLTSIEMPYEQIGFEAARMLDRLMDARSQGHSADVQQESPEVILLPPVGIVARRSTDFHAVDDPLVREALRYIDENLHQEITLDLLAKAALVSRRTLTDRFRDKLGRSVTQEVQRLRIERVKRELTDSDQSIKRIARRAGFGSQRTLNDVFNAAVGCTPSQYRHQRTTGTKNG